MLLLFFAVNVHIKVSIAQMSDAKIQEQLGKLHFSTTQTRGSLRKIILQIHEDNKGATDSQTLWL